MKPMIAFVSLLLLIGATEVRAGTRSAAVKETAEYVMNRFGREATKELGEDATQVLARRMETLAARHGEEVVTRATRNVGPRVFRLVEEVGEDGAPHALRLMARQGDEAVWLIARPRGFALFVRYGDEAGDAIIRHREVGETLIENFGAPMSRALARVNGQSGRRLAMLADERTLAAVPQRDALLDTIARHGDRAMDWVWRNKGALLTAGVVAAFVADPQPFIDGTVRVAEIGADKIAGPMVHQAAKTIDWNLLAGASVACAAVVVGAQVLRRPRARKV